MVPTNEKRGETNQAWLPEKERNTGRCRAGPRPGEAGSAPMVYKDGGRRGRGREDARDEGTCSKRTALGRR